MSRMLEDSWIFPDIKHSCAEKFKHDGKVHDYVDKENVHAKNDKHKNTDEENRLVLENIKKSYEEKILSLKNLIQNLPLHSINNDVINLLQDIIKKSVKRIVYKEIDTDPAVLNQMIAELKNSLQQKGAVTIFVSAKDFEFLSPVADYDLQVDSTLNRGDIIVKSAFGQVRAILNERIDKLLGTSND